MIKIADKALADIATPAYVIDIAALERNMKILADTAKEAGCRILLAQKAFSAFCCYPLMSKYLSGTTASGLYEARLGREEFGGEVHVFSPAYKESEIEEIIRLCDHAVFNSAAQLKKFSARCKAAGVSVGLRINPECSTQSEAIYDPCAEGSRLGVRSRDMSDDLMKTVDGLHFHTLCEQDSDALEQTLKAVEEKFGKYLPLCKWANFGGGHHITRPDYDRERLVRLVKNFREKYNVEVYLEPGEAAALNAGWLVTEVMDIVNSGIDVAVLDASAACHMPDVLEMPYRPPLYMSGVANEKPHTYRLSSRTCLAGDIIGDYSFDKPLEIGDRLCFEDMAIYSMVKNNTFNGMPLPDILKLNSDGSIETVKKFGYEDFKGRLS